MSWFSLTAVINCYKLSMLKQNTVIIFQLWEGGHTGSYGRNWRDGEGCGIPEDVAFLEMTWAAPALPFFLIVLVHTLQRMQHSELKNKCQGQPDSVLTLVEQDVLRYWAWRSKLFPGYVNPVCNAFCPLAVVWHNTWTNRALPLAVFLRPENQFTVHP